MAVLVALAGLFLGTRPLATPTQDCGTPFTFLLRGRLDEFHDPAQPPPGATSAEVEANNSEPCQQRAADRARPAAIVMVGATTVGAGAALVDLGVRGTRWYRARPPRP